MSEARRLSGVFAPVVTPFGADLKPDAARLLRHCQWLLSQNAGLDLHVEKRYGRSPHHIVEAVFKGLARALRIAVEIDPRETGLPTVKGAL